MEGESFGVMDADVVRFCHHGRGVIWCDGGSVTWYVCCRRDSASWRPPLRASWPTYWASASVWCTTAMEVRGTRTCRNCGQWMRALTSTMNRKTNDGDHSHSKVKLESVKWIDDDDDDVVMMMMVMLIAGLILCRSKGCRSFVAGVRAGDALQMGKWRVHSTVRIS